MNDDPRWIHVLRDLVLHPQGRTSADLLYLYGGDGGSAYERQKHLSHCAGDLRKLHEKRYAERSHKLLGGWGKPNPWVWKATPSGAGFIPARDANLAAEAAEAAEAVVAAEVSARTKAAVLADVVSHLEQPRLTPRPQRRELAKRLRDAGCTMREIGDVFGVSREMARQDLLPWTPRELRPDRHLGSRFIYASIAGSMLAIRVGKRTIYLTPAEAQSLAGTIDEWLAPNGSNVCLPGKPHPPAGAVRRESNPNRKEPPA